jgi:hypothetical protein
MKYREVNFEEEIVRSSCAGSSRGTKLDGSVDDQSNGM